MTKLNLGPGMHPDIKIINKKLYAAWQIDYLWLRVEQYDVRSLALESVWDFPLAPGTAAYPRLGLFNNNVAVIYRDGEPDFRAVLRYLKTGEVEVLDQIWGNSPVAIGYGWVAWQRLSDRMVVKRREGESAVEVVQPSAPTGISNIDSNGWVSTVDATKDTIPGYTMAFYGDGCRIAEDLESGNMAWLPDGRKLKFFDGEESFTPHCSCDGEFFAACTDGDMGVRFGIAKVEEFAADPIITPLPRPLWLGYFKVMGRYGEYTPKVLELGTNIAFGGVFDCDTDLDESQKWAQFIDYAEDMAYANAGMIAHWNEVGNYRAYWNKVVCIWVDNLDQITKAEEVRNTFELSKKPYLYYTDSELPPEYVQPPQVDWQAIYGYLDPSEQSDAPERLLMSLQRQSERLPGQTPIVIVAQAYDRNGAWINMLTLAAMQPVYAEFARRDPRVVGILWFSYARPGGVLDHQELLPWHKAIIAANPGTPQIIEPPETPIIINPELQAPKIDVTTNYPKHFSPNMTLISWDDRNNPASGGRVTMENGSIHVELWNSSGRDKTGKRREIQ